MQAGTEVSVIINNYNYGAFIQESIDSVLKQAYTNWELVIVDDGSKDCSRQIISSYAERFPDKITAVFKPNGGQGSALNIGFSLARGSIIAFLDSDDYWYPNKLETVVKAHENHDLVAHNQEKEGEYGNASMNNFGFQERGKEFLRRYGLVNWYNASTSAVSCKREILEKIFPVPQEARICVDVYLLLNAIYYSNMYYIDEKLGFYRIHDKNNFYGNADSSWRLQAMIQYSKEKLNKKLEQAGEASIPELDLEHYRRLLEKEEGFYINPGRYIVYGASTGAKRVADYISYCGGEVYAFCDSKSEKWGQYFLNKPIFSPAELSQKRQEYDKIVIGSMWIKEIKEILEAEGLREKKDFLYSRIGFWMNFNE